MQEQKNFPTPRLGASGRIAAAFQSNAITPLLALVALLLGLFAVLVTPREEEPQINVTITANRPSSKATKASKGVMALD